MSAGERTQAALIGAAAGFFGGLFGVGGGLILIPLFTSRLRMTQHQAHGTSLAVIVFTALAGGIVYALNHNVDVLTGLIVGIAAIAAAPLGVRLAARLSGTGLKRAFSVFLLLVAARLFWAPAEAGGTPLGGFARIAADVATGAGVGVMAGFMGVGGGILAVPAFRLLFGMSQPLAQGTSLLVILGAAGSGAIAHARRGNVVGTPVPWLALGAMIAGPLSSWWVQHLPQALLQRAFAIFLVANAIHGWIRTMRAPATASR